MFKWFPLFVPKTFKKTVVATMFLTKSTPASDSLKKTLKHSWSAPWAPLKQPLKHSWSTPREALKQPLEHPWSNPWSTLATSAVKSASGALQKVLQGCFKKCSRSALKSDSGVLQKVLQKVFQKCFKGAPGIASLVLQTVFQGCPGRNQKTYISYTSSLYPNLCKT